MHPVLYYYSKVPDQFGALYETLTPKERIDILVGQAIKKHHFLEDFLTFWTDLDKHQLHFRRFIESILKKNLKIYHRNYCLMMHASFGTYPTMCSIYYHE